MRKGSPAIRERGSRQETDENDHRKAAGELPDTVNRFRRGGKNERNERTAAADG